MIAVAPEIIGIIVTVVLGGGIFGTVALLLKVRPEAGQMTVVSAEKVVVMQQTFVDRLTAANERLEAQAKANTDIIAELRDRLDGLEDRCSDLALENERLKEEVKAHVLEKQSWEQERVGLRARIKVLEDEVAELRTASSP